jgi:cytochrome c peroxidase
MKNKLKIAVRFIVGIQLFLFISCSQPSIQIEPISIHDQKITFGKELFFDKQLSINGTISCGSCHLPEKYFCDNETKGRGIHGRSTNRNVPSLLNIKEHPYFMYDGGVKTLEMQLLVPIQDTNEMGEQMGSVLKKLRKNKSYVAKSKSLYHRDLDAFVVSRAIAEYERSLVASESKYDLYKANKAKLSVQELDGEKLFIELRCDRCHSGNKFTNFSFQDNGLALKSEADFGRYRITGKSEDKWKFKVPTLKNCAKTAPYLHDGSLKSLAEVIHAYENTLNQQTKIKKLSEKELKSLILFLNTLTEKIENQ